MIGGKERFRAHDKAGFTPKDYDKKSGIIRMVQADGDMSSMRNEQSCA